MDTEGKWTGQRDARSINEDLGYLSAASVSISPPLKDVTAPGISEGTSGVYCDKLTVSDYVFK